MGWISRIVVAVAAFGVGCASLAGIDDGPTMSEDALSSSGGTSSGSSGTSSGSSGTSSGSSGSGSNGDGGSRGDAGAPIDAAKDVTPTPQCPLPRLPDKSECTGGTSCCSDKCGEDRRCVGGCKTSTFWYGCSPGSDDCCLGSYCSINARAACVKCIEKDEAAEIIFGIERARSCCSGRESGGTCVAQ